jgi:hypothetical protein
MLIFTCSAIVQIAFLWLPSEDRLLAITSRVRRTADPQLPTFLDEGCETEATGYTHRPI